MAHVALSRPSSGCLQSAGPSRLVTEARVQHKAVKRMTRNRPKKVSTLSTAAKRCHFAKLSLAALVPLLLKQDNLLQHGSDRRHKPTQYPALPPPPPQYTVVSTVRHTAVVNVCSFKDWAYKLACPANSASANFPTSDTSCSLEP